MHSALQKDTSSPLDDGPSATAGTSWHSMPEKQVFEALRTSAAGLGDDDVAERLERYGPNDIPPTTAARSCASSCVSSAIR